jgi:hypothetical protein
MVTRLAIAALFLCALSGTSDQRRARRVWQQPNSADASERAAQVALLVLRATTQGAMSTRAYSILPSRVPNSLDEASRLLAIMRKPVRCSGKPDGEILTVTCLPLDEEETREHERGATLHVTSLEREAQEQCSVPADETNVLLRWQGSQRSVPFRFLAQWLREYDMLFSLGSVQSIEPPEGTCLILQVRPPAKVKINSPASTHRS